MILISKMAATHIADWGSNWGSLDLFVDEGEGIATVAGYRNKDGLKLPVATPWMKRHHLWRQDKREDAAVWYRVDPSIHAIHEPLLRRGAAIPTEDLRDAVLSGWVSPPVDEAMAVLALSGTGEDVRWSSWWVSRDQAAPGFLHVVDEEANALDFLKPMWPLENLVDTRVTLIGCGSIGSATADVLLAYGIRKLYLVDPDRLLLHNVVRHQLTDRHLGRYKARAMKQELEDKHPGASVDALPLDVTLHANVLRPMFRESGIVIGTTDGVESRRVINHLAKRAGVPLVLACVLEDGAIGEVLRIRAGGGCLMCNRLGLVDGGSMDPEGSLDLGYGTGSRHRPMTAVGGDLHLVGALAAKVAIATLLEIKGYRGQQLPGEQALVSLQAIPHLASPFDLEKAGILRWRDRWASRPDCPSCSSA